MTSSLGKPNVRVDPSSAARTSYSNASRARLAANLNEAPIMNLRHWIVGAALAAGVGIVLCYVRCSGDAAAAETKSTESTSRSVNREVTLGGKSPARADNLVLAYPADPDTLNPVTATDVQSEEFRSLVYEAFAERQNE